MQLGFTFDIVCPFAYLASTQIEALAARFGYELQWNPVLLGGLFQHLGQPAQPANSWPISKVENNIRDLARQAEMLEVPLSPPKDHPRRSVEAMRLLVAAPPEVRPSLAHRLYASYWQNGEDIADRTVLERHAQALGLDLGQIDAPEVKKELRDRTQTAFEKGIFGVPTLEVGEDWWWGVDRLEQVAEALGAPTPPRKTQGPSSGRTLRFFHDFSSPFAYLASTQVERIAQAHGAQLESIPILLGALFAAIGTPDVPLFAMSPQRQDWMTRDMQRWADWWDVPLNFPSQFPLRTVAPLRVALLEPRTVRCLYRAAWVGDRNIGDSEILTEVLNEHGFDGAELVVRTQEPSIKAQLRSNTEHAARIGVCGVPAFQVDDGPLFWGQDRLAMVEKALGGWVPSIDEERGPVGGFL